MRDEQGPAPDDEPSASLAVIATLVYGLFTVAAIVWLYLRERTDLLSRQALGDYGAFGSLAIGTVVGLSIAGGIALLVRYVRTFASLEDRLREVIGPLSEAEITLIALASAIGEELFFRCAVQDLLGPLLTAAVFGLLHTGPGLWIMGLFAGVLGLCFGWMVEGRMGLLSVTVAHALINFISLRRMALT